MKKLLLLALLLLAPMAHAAPCQTGCPGLTALECASRGLRAHEWCEFANATSYPGCANSAALCHDDLASCGSGEPNPTEQEQMFWDAERKQLKSIGGPHNGSESVTIYDAATNAWRGFVRGGQIPTNVCDGGIVDGCSNSPMVTGRHAALICVGPGPGRDTCAGSSPGAIECTSTAHCISQGYASDTCQPCSCSQVAHTYDAQTGDSARGVWYKQAYNTTGYPIYSWDGDGLAFDSSTWGTLPTSSFCTAQGDIGFTAAITYFPDRIAGDGIFRLCRGDFPRIDFWDRATNAWSTLRGNVDDAACTLNTPLASAHHQWIEYHPYAKLIWFGGPGAGSEGVGCTYDASGTFDQEIQPPSSFVKFSDNGALIAGDPSSNAFIVRNECWNSSDGTTLTIADAWKTYDPITETWANITWSMPTLYDDTLADANNCGATDNMDVAIPEYNVIMYLTHGGQTLGDPRAYLYRHSPTASFTLTSATSQTLAPFAVGHAFKQGDIPAGAGIVSNLTNFQATIKSAWPDGSAQFAILAGRATLVGGTPLTVELYPGTPAGGTNLTETNLTATGANALVTFGSVGSVQLSSLIGVTAAYQSGGAVGRWGPGLVRQWISGPQMSSWIYSAPIGSDPVLSAWFEVRLWAGGAVEIIPWIENGYVLKTGVTEHTQTASVSISSVSQFSQLVKLRHHQRLLLGIGTTLSYWFNTGGTSYAITPKHDVDYMARTTLIPPYKTGLNGPAHSLWSGMATSFVPYNVDPIFDHLDTIGVANYDPDQTSTGYHKEVGPLPQWDAIYVTGFADPRARTASLINHYSAGRYGYHYRDEVTNEPMKPSTYATRCISQSGNSGISSSGACVQSANYLPASGGRAPPTWDTAHHPSVGYFPYLLTGQFYFLEEVQFSAGLTVVKNYAGLCRGGSSSGNGCDNAGQCSGGTCVARPIIHTNAGSQTERGASWSLRTIAQALLATPDADTLNTEWQSIIDQNVDWYYDTYVTAANNPFGFPWPYADYGPPNGTAAFDLSGFMDNYLVFAFSFIHTSQATTAGALRTEARDMARWKAQTSVKRLGLPGVSTEWDFRDAANYAIAVSPSSSPNWYTGTGPWYSDWGAMYQASVVTSCVGGTNNGGACTDSSFCPGGSCGLGQGTAPTNTLRKGNFPDFTSYWGRFQAAISYAVMVGATGAPEAYARMTGASNWPTLDANFDDAPENAIVPFATGGSTVAPLHPCSDSFDNDGDGATDFPADTGCSGGSDPDNSERGAIQCDNGLDDDSNLLTDYCPAGCDPGCASIADNTEATPAPPAGLSGGSMPSGKLGGG